MLLLLLLVLGITSVTVVADECTWTYSDDAKTLRGPGAFHHRIFSKDARVAKFTMKCSPACQIHWQTLEVFKRGGPASRRWFNVTNVTHQIVDTDVLNKNVVVVGLSLTSQTDLTLHMAECYHEFGINEALDYWYVPFAVVGVFVAMAVMGCICCFAFAAFRSDTHESDDREDEVTQDSDGDSACREITCSSPIGDTYPGVENGSLYYDIHSGVEIEPYDDGVVPGRERKVVERKDRPFVKSISIHWSFDSPVRIAYDHVLGPTISQHESHSSDGGDVQFEDLDV